MGDSILHLVVLLPFLYFQLALCCLVKTPLSSLPKIKFVSVSCMISWCASLVGLLSRLTDYSDLLHLSLCVFNSCPAHCPDQVVSANSLCVSWCPKCSCLGVILLTFVFSAWLISLFSGRFPPANWITGCVFGPSTPAWFLPPLHVGSACLNDYRNGDTSKRICLLLPHLLPWLISIWNWVIVHLDPDRNHLSHDPCFGQWHLSPPYSGL